MKYLLFVVLILVNAKLLARDKTYNLVIPDLPPVGCHKREGQPYCLSQQVAQKLAVHANIKIKAHVMPVPRTVKSILEKKYELIMLNYDPSLVEKADIVAKLFQAPLAIFTNNTDFLLEKPSNKRVPVLRGVKHQELTKKLGPFTEVPVLNHQQVVGMFARGRLDAVIGPKQYMLTALERHSINVNQLYEPFTYDPVDIYLYCTKGSCSAGIKKRFSQAANSITQMDVEHIMSVLGNYEFDN